MCVSMCVREREKEAAFFIPKTRFQDFSELQMIFLFHAQLNTRDDYM